MAILNVKQVTFLIRNMADKHGVPNRTNVVQIRLRLFGTTKFVKRVRKLKLLPSQISFRSRPPAYYENC